jgi:predicted ATPase/DNA-binding SARP family transcriptional activator
VALPPGCAADRDAVRIDADRNGSVIAMRCRVLGPVELVDGDARGARLSPMRRRLLAVLLVHAGDAVSADRLVDQLWPDEPPADAAASLHAHVSRLRAALRSVRVDGSPELVTTPTGYRLVIADDQLDATRFERLVAMARTSPDTGTAVDLLDEALGLWRGPAYAEFADEQFAAAEAARLSELRLGAVEQRAELLLALGRHAELLAPLERFTAEHPLRERARAALMRAQYRSGRAADALAVFRDLRERLVTELGIEPSPALQRLHAELLAQRPEAAAAPDAPAASLPVPVTSFVGREAEVAAVSAALREARLLTLTGVGGVGKTRLALAVAAAVERSYPDGVRFCELAPVAEPAAVAPAVATALGVARPGRGTAEDGVVAALRGRCLLLVLDNCEHLVDAAGRLAHRLIAECPRVTVLATSRQPLAVNGEHRRPVAPLPLPTADDPGPAVQLFADRAAAADPAFDPAAEAATAAEICRRLDGVPLAIELAAARAAVLGPGELARRLDQRFRLLSSGPRTSQRHRSLAALVDWSYELLSPVERTVFARLSVFTGSFTLHAAEEVCSGDGIERGDVAAIVGELADRSLVVVDRAGHTPRYRLLETLRQYGSDRLAAADAAGRVRHRFVAHFLKIAECAEPHLRGRDEAYWVARLDRELDNLRGAHHRALESGDLDAAVRLPVALHYYAHFRIRSEIPTWAERALDLPGVGAHRLLAPLCGTAAEGAGNRGDLARARELADRGLLAAGGETEAALRPLETHAVVALYEGRLRDCAVAAERVRRIAEAAGEPFHVAFGLLHEALACAYAGDRAAAGELADAAARYARAAGNPSQLAWAAYAHGEALADDDPDRALGHFEECIARAEPVRNAMVIGVAQVAVSAVRSRHGSTIAALRSFRDVIEHWRHVDDRTHQWTTLRNLTELLARVHADEAAAVLHGAVTHPGSGAPAFGSGRRRLAATAAELTARLGESAFAAATLRGAALSAEEVATFACAEIERAIAQREP